MRDEKVKGLIFRKFQGEDVLPIVFNKYDSLLGFSVKCPNCGKCWTRRKPKVKIKDGYARRRFCGYCLKPFYLAEEKQAVEKK